MKTDWSREEVEATVSDYFEMLDSELRGTEYNKTSHRRNLSKFLTSARMEQSKESIKILVPYLLS